jgi:hypothetical protein
MIPRLLKFGFGLTLALTLTACNLPSSEATPTPDSAATYVALTLSAIETSNASIPTAEALTDTPTPPPTETGTPTPIPTPQNPLVLKDALCWQGPGPVYEVVSSVKKDARVEILGRGSSGGWWIIRNPIYKDPCWLMGDVLQFDTGFNVSGLKVFDPPPTPTLTPRPTNTPTNTPLP